MYITRNEIKNSSKVLSQEWKYRGEGNANLIISLPDLHKVIRLKKCEKPTKIFEILMECILKYFPWNFVLTFSEERDLDLKFYTNIMVPLLGPNFVSSITPITITKKEIYELNISLKSQRPENRKHKMLFWGKASLLNDHAMLPKEWEVDLTGSTLAIEIKPKQAWIPYSDRHNTKCPYCLNQFVKAKNNIINSISGYCPLDLFSGRQDRMKYALKSLMENPQNNFRIFKDGDCVYNENLPTDNLIDAIQEFLCDNDKLSSMNTFITVLYNLLMKTDNNSDNDEDLEYCDINYHKEKNEEKEDKKCDFSKGYLPRGSILERIYELQKMDKIGLDNNFLLYKHLRNNQNAIKEWEYIEKFSKLNFTSPQQLLIELETHFENNLKKEEDKRFERLDETFLVPYVIASIANDCSLMITIRKVKNVNNLIPKNSMISFGKHGIFATGFGIFDLYPKPLSVIQKHKLRNEKRLVAYNSMIY